MKIKFNYYPGGRKKALTMSYDDGFIYDRRLVEIFNQYGIKGTFHLNAGRLDGDQTLNSGEIRELFKGHEVSSHTLTHPFISLVPRNVLVDEILEDRRILEALAGYPVRGMSYPYGDFTAEILKILPAVGIEYSRTTLSHGRFSLPSDFFTWHPTCHHDDHLMERLKRFKNTAVWEQMPLFYVWGHSHEFDKNNNWGMMEDFCKAAAQDAEVWYASNVEIMDYLIALRNLKFSVDKKYILNQSSIPVWIDIDGEAVEIKSGALYSSL